MFKFVGHKDQIVQSSNSDRIELVQNRVQAGLRTHAATGVESRKRAVQLADKLDAIHNGVDAIGLGEGEDAQTVEHALGGVNRTTLRRLRKVTEVVEDDLAIDAGHAKFARVAATGARLTSAGAFVIAGHNLLLSADELDTANEQVSSVTEIKERRFIDFYRAVCLFCAEAILFSTPFNFQLAWKGTRIVNNRAVYRLRNYAPSLHRLVLSEIHYAIRGLVPTALRSPDSFIEYLTSMASQTVSLFRQFEDIEIAELQPLVKQTVEEYQTFVVDAYEVVVPDVDLSAIVKSVVQEFTGLDFAMTPTEQAL
jgi:hypothetical protein